MESRSLNEVIGGAVIEEAKEGRVKLNNWTTRFQRALILKRLGNGILTSDSSTCSPHSKHFATIGGKHTKRPRRPEK